jgi:hypothetical protein
MALVHDEEDVGTYTKRFDNKSLVLIYISLAGGCVIIGTGLTFGLLAICAYYQIDLTQNWWLLLIPLAATLGINVFLIELYKKLTRR